ncbi:hypothetical protein CEXT_600881 [Caerostris extrusa]|uniref:Uncharacterized protein n=1 Tax=Caerostris extrusa TaxID=172846 RepID=A0AAV4U200_CAEEX|nr:hypothetical protein CEXT_600881 [Caerostris extrusa]
MVLTKALNPKLLNQSSVSLEEEVEEVLRNENYVDLLDAVWIVCLLCALGYNTLVYLMYFNICANICPVKSEQRLKLDFGI